MSADFHGIVGTTQPPPFADLNDTNTINGVQLVDSDDEDENEESEEDLQLGVGRFSIGFVLLCLLHMIFSNTYHLVCAHDHTLFYAYTHARVRNE